MASMTPLLPEPFGPEIAKVCLLKVDIELADAANFLDMGAFKLDHFTSPPTGAVKILMKSSAFGFLLSSRSF